MQTPASARQPRPRQPAASSGVSDWGRATGGLESPAEPRGRPSRCQRWSEVANRGAWKRRWDGENGGWASGRRNGLFDERNNLNGTTAAGEISGRLQPTNAVGAGHLLGRSPNYWRSFNKHSYSSACLFLSKMPRL